MSEKEITLSLEMLILNDLLTSNAIDDELYKIVKDKLQNKTEAGDSI